MKELTVNQVVLYTGGHLFCGSADAVIKNVNNDSRKVTEDSLFVGFKGENNDGNDFAVSAYGNGCRSFLLSSPQVAGELHEKYENTNIILMDDPLRGMQRIAREYLAGCDIIKIAVTGSNGKTTTKEMLQCVFSSKFNTVSNYENFNNHIGVPLTAFTVEENTQVGIFEMGMNHLGEIELLADIVHPATALITNVGTAHLGNLGSRENILRAKMEISKFFNDENTLIYNSDNDMLAAEMSKKHVFKVTAVGEKSAEPVSGFSISDIKDFGDGGISFLLEHDGEKQEFRLNVPGRHNAWNAAMAAACGAHYGIDMASSAKALENFKNTQTRLQITENAGIKVINDTYNASPDSMRAALKVLQSAQGKRRVAVLADMFELGTESEKMHEEVLKFALELGIDLIIAVGKTMSSAADSVIREAASAGNKAGNKTGNKGETGGDGSITDGGLITGGDGSITGKIICADSNDEAVILAGSRIRQGDTILVKGSHGMHMEKVARYLAETGAWND